MSMNQLEMSGAGGWIEGARDAIEQIGVELREPGAAASGTEISLGVGSLGAALLDAQAPAATLRAAARRRVEQAVAVLAEAEMDPSLYMGFAGVAWCVEHLRERLFPELQDDPNAAIDDALCGLLARSPWSGHFDLVSGLVGLGVYALERLPRPRAAECVAAVVARLAERAHQDADGIAWWTAPGWLTPPMRLRHPRGYDNLGLAHGIAGVIALLAAVCRSGIAVAPARALLEGAVAWLLAKQRAGQGGPRFPSLICRERGPQGGRLGWCHGDPGIAIALLQAGRAAGVPAWEAAALAIARDAARMPPEQTGVLDAGVCHGASGLALIFSRLFHATGDPLFQEAARDWARRTLAFRVPGSGIAGFSALDVDDGGGAAWRADAGLMGGAAGIGLALHAVLSPAPPAWDRILLLSHRQPPC